MIRGQVGILNVGTGDTKLSFDKNNPSECIRAARIVTDMIRRGYALLVEVERNGEKAYQRVKEFREDTCEYIIADFDPMIAAEVDKNEEDENHEEKQISEEYVAPKPSLKEQKRRGPKSKNSDRRIDASDARAIAIPRRAGG